MNNLIKYFTIYFIIINFVSFILMYIDKRRAIKKEWRISEHTLILISLLGGSIGSLIGMYTFRHKTKHLKFKVGIPIILVIQLFVIANIIR
ncbi:DUF1294 domain-containing protein [Clostridium sp. NSJ-145]|uniref:DUF1294 domain-containing protein n=1 Tax=Clostridium sp. NSJ-145 TaxID=2897777 RepID=UPI003FA42CB9